MSAQHDGTGADGSRAARPGVSRRALFGGGLAAAGAGAGVYAGAGALFANGPAATPTRPSGELIDLTGRHPFYATADASPQAGIRTAPQRYGVLAAFDVTSSSAADLQVLLARWSASIAQLQKGNTVGLVEPAHGSGAGVDTGEALDLGPASLTVTLGLGPGIFDERFGLADKRPARLAALPALPALPSDRLDAALTGGDLSLQACADDPQVAYHAIRDLTRIARGNAAVRWTVLGFGRASAGPDQATPRNLLGFKDGTRNIRTEDDYRRWVWAGSDEGWMAGGSYQVVRKIQMNIEIWDADPISDQQRVFGRTKTAGAPLSGGREHTTPDFHATLPGGGKAIDPTSHIALAAHENNGGLKILRRSYNYTDGINQYGQLDAGLLFIAYMNDPDHFVRLQKRLGASDRLNEYISHIGSAVFAVPPAPKAGSYIGKPLFG
ncbi:Dyp-type peroxidase [Streptomyces sp. NRRL F-5126]|uniref:Dyp-type peroxidase n=1 Tax=Streptomyces sp. NRRL F-5126 TaxID=1463857 RepID=UPI0004C96959|nr:Dyp-type peroxidase [Streptomyces sp. NRRL F-5126]